ncbi:uncharacterized protein LOC126834941 [Adelges cooleyi]|uniref:uncharacterized protein LOC126834941 n=1 Tax=Adelges cooleyi TaxID=133065 RepID=UPI00217F76FD|nr:uncharacterized protein LOC126834941 [Adelges cooleyi]
MTSIIQVITLLCFFLIPLFLPQAIGDDQLSQIPDLDTLKDVYIWKNKGITSIGKMYGSQIINKKVKSEDFKVITDMSLTALSCLYSENIIYLLQTINSKIVKCDKSDKNASRLVQCFQNIILQLKSLGTSVVIRMLTTLFNYKKKFSSPANKHLLNAITAVHLFINNIEIDTLSTDPKKIDEQFVSEFLTVNLYTRNTIEAFAVFNCSFEKNLIKTSNEEYDAKTVEKLYLPETYFKREMFDSKNLLLTNVVFAQLDSKIKKDFTLGLMYVRNNIRNDTIGEIHYSLMHISCPEIVTKFQTIVFQSISSLILYSVGKINKYLTEQGRTMSPSTEAIIEEAIDILIKFKFPGFSQLTLKKLLYDRIYRPRSYGLKEEELVEYNVRSLLKEFYEINIERLTTLLKYFTSQLTAMEIYIKNAIMINEYLCDYDYEEIGFLQYDYTKIVDFEGIYYQTLEDHFKMTSTLELSKNYSCELSYVAIKHFMFNDFIISQCRQLLESNKNDSQAWKKLTIECFEIIKKSITSIETTFSNSLAAISTPHLEWPYTHTNRKVIDAILAAKLYFNSDDLLGSFKDKPVNINSLLSKFEIFQRSDRFIVNLFEQYTVHNCATRLPSDDFTDSISTAINEKCKAIIDKNLTIPIVECVSNLIEENYKYIQNFEMDIDRNKILTIENWLLNDIFDNSLISSNSLSKLHSIKVLLEGDWRKLKEIRDLAKENINPKYLICYLVAMIKSIYFMAYEHIKTIVQTSVDHGNLLLYRNNLNTMSIVLKSLDRSFPVNIMMLYRRIVYYFVCYFKEDTNASAFVRLLEAEQSNLGLKNDVEINEVEHAAGQENINNLRKYVADVKKIWTKLTYVTDVLDLRELYDI